MKRKRVRCPRCGLKYEARALRCPDCSAPRPVALGAGLSRGDRIVGVVLIVIGAVLVIPAFWLMYWALRFGGLRLKMGSFMIVVIPIGAIFNGLLLVNGVHPRAFYSWWENLSDLTQYLIWAALAVIVAVVVIAFMFGGVGQPDPQDFEPDME
jgi:hypothetical protein